MVSLPEMSPTVDRIVGVLSCLAVDHRLGGVLMLDLPPAMLPVLGRWLAARIGDGTEVVSLGSSHSDDDLWWRAGMHAEDGAFRLRPRPGVLVEAPGAPPRLLLVPDLSRAGLAVRRAAVTLIGAGTAVADRHGQHQSWQPRARWLAACPRAGLARLSPHLLDRFAVRVDAAGLTRTVRGVSALRAAVDGDDAEFLPPSGPLPPPGRLPALTGDAARLAVELIGAAAAPTRRDLAVARTARALAILDLSSTTTPDHVRRAADLLQLSAAEPAHPQTADTAPPAEPVPEPADDEPAPGIALVAGAALETVTTLPVLGNLDEMVVPTTDPPPASLFPEDNSEALPEYATLRLPSVPSRRKPARTGPVIGAEPTRSLTDVAVVPTVLEAAKFQSIRNGFGGRLVLHPSDLRRHRHAPHPGAALVLLIDHSCGHDWDRAGALAPYLRWAYTSNASVSVVELGHRDSTDELRAQRYRAGSVLDERIAMSLGRSPGRATPLAYGLDLAVQELRRYLRRGPAAAGRVWFVVVSDGRGNVSLEVSLRRRIAGPVGAAGVADALTVAAAVRGMPPVSTVVLAPPGLTHYADLPFRLAEAMEGIVAEPEGQP
jgi:magnesium chelatase subunit D